MKLELPLFLENSNVPRLLSVVSPIDIGAITLGPLVFVSGPASSTLKNHERIHWEQYKECLIVGFLILYCMFWIKGILSGYSRTDSYLSIPFEREAYENDINLEYLNTRKKFTWTSYL